jgi:hypothetical protein
VGPSHDDLSKKLKEISKYRDKIMHGQVSGRDIKAEELRTDILTLIDWINLLGEGAHAAFGYDGLKRNTYKQAKKCVANVAAKYPFDKPVSMLQWIADIKR